MCAHCCPVDDVLDRKLRAIRDKKVSNREPGKEMYMSFKHLTPEQFEAVAKPLLMSTSLWNDALVACLFLIKP